MKELIVAAGAAIALIGVAQAQDAAAGFAAFCEKDVRAQGYSERQAFGGCACGAGVLGGSLTDRQWYILGRLMPGMASDDQLVQIIQGMIAEGYSQAEILGVAQSMDVSGAKISRVCAYYEAGASGTMISLKEEEDDWEDLVINEAVQGVEATLTEAGKRLTPALTRASRN